MRRRWNPRRPQGGGYRKLRYRGVLVLMLVRMLPPMLLRDRLQGRLRVVMIREKP
jgi:hypothetical protein